MSLIALHHILLKSPLLAQDVLKESACPSGQNQGFAGYHQAEQLPPALVAALEQNDQAYLGPIATELGYHILKAKL
jgi:peptidyl-prolyl cis-trans isomerase C